MQTNPIILVTGPARSGKSEWAEQLAEQTARSVIYVATALLDPEDAEWQWRIEQHRQRRPSSWQTIEAPLNLAETIRDARPNHCLLVDSLGTWVTNWLAHEESWTDTETLFLESLQQTTGTIILVAEEVGWGVVPAYPVGRLFRDRLGQLVQKTSRLANQTYLVIAGHVLDLTRLGIKPF